MGCVWMWPVPAPRPIPRPGENPHVQAGTLEQDLARRDFTVNAMALVLRMDHLNCLTPSGSRASVAAPACVLA